VSDTSADSILRLPLGSVSAVQHAAPDSMLQALDGSKLRWGGANTPGPVTLMPAGAPASITIAVSPVRPGHAVTVEYRVDDGPVRETAAQPDYRVPAFGERIFRAAFPAPLDGLVEFLPVLRFAGQPISPQLSDSIEPSRFQIGRAAANNASAPTLNPLSGPPTREPCWGCEIKFLASLKTSLREQLIGRVPDGLRINWYVEEGSFAGPDVSGIVLPGSGDWMRIREDGIALVNVRASLQTSDGARIYATYSGILDLGSDGYARAILGEFAPFPPIVVSPVFQTSDTRYSWLNRLQCTGVGRVDTATRSYELDIYSLQVGERRRAE
jgi:Protein of unknown function (DUF3237)